MAISRHAGGAAVGLHAPPARVTRLGVKPLGGRTGAVMTLATTLPPTILAELLGSLETSASKWYRLVGGEWGQLRRPRHARYDTPAGLALDSWSS